MQDKGLTSRGKHGRVVESHPGAVDDDWNAWYTLEKKRFVYVTELH